MSSNMASEEFISANNVFAINVYKEVLKDNQGNFLSSPLSAETIVAFAQAGCKNETAQEIQNALQLPSDKEKTELGIKSFLLASKDAEKYTLNSANKMYVKEGFHINEEFKKVAIDIYQSGSENIDFTDNVVAAETMNMWVENQTNNKIHNLIKSADLDEDTRLILINALYFKADWFYPFSSHNTHKKKFHKTANDSIEVDMMSYSAKCRRRFNYCECKELGAKFLELQFEGGDASMTFILPNEIDGLAVLENQLEKVFVRQQLEHQLVNIFLPIFKIESTIDFKEVLKNLGVEKAFDEEEADLSGIAGEKGDLIIDKIVQKTFIDLNEKGVEAAAATVVLIKIPKSGSDYIPPQFIADHPFIFYIKIKGAIAFVGRVIEPIQ